ncbi:MAG: nicotinamidase [Myxococcaceae bacterium]|nr:nicotinamidase [Myxococcaceae bacterium]
MVLPLPDFYQPSQVPQLYMERAQLVAESAERYARKHAVKPSAQDTFRMAAFGIDVQVAFCTPGASLFVPGAVEDTQRTVEWLYRNLDKISSLHFSMDTHRVFHIFHPSWWVDEKGQHPAPFTPILHEDVQSGKWRALTHANESLEYVERLEASGKYVLTIWPYHALLGGLSHALVPAVMETAIFHATARGQPTHFETKGMHALTENYSVFSPEVTKLAGQKVGAFNTALFAQLMKNDRVYVFGQAKSHCVLSTLNDMLAQARQVDERLLSKIFILEDAMSPVQPPPLNPLPAQLDFPSLANRAMEQWREAGMHVVKTTDTVVS